MFSVPCCYLRVWNESGSYLSTEQIQLFLDSDSSTVTSNNHCQLISDYHPYSNKIYSTFHVCDLEKRLPKFNPENLNSIESIHTFVEYLLCFISIIGPDIGMCLNATEYKNILNSCD